MRARTEKRKLMIQANFTILIFPFSPRPWGAAEIRYCTSATKVNVPSVPLHCRALRALATPAANAKRDWDIHMLPTPYAKNLPGYLVRRAILLPIGRAQRDQCAAVRRLK